MREIELTQGQVAKVDDEDFRDINRYKWYALKRTRQYHACRNIMTDKGKRPFYMHSAIIGLPPFGYEIDHRDRDGLNNIKSNLRFVTRRQNMQNLEREGTTSKYPGVYWVKARCKWAAGYYIGEKRFHIGYYIDEREAFEAYRATIYSLGENMLEEFQ